MIVVPAVIVNSAHDAMGACHEQKPLEFVTKNDDHYTVPTQNTYQHAAAHSAEQARSVEGTETRETRRKDQKTVRASHLSPAVTPLLL